MTVPHVPPVSPLTPLRIAIARRVLGVVTGEELVALATTALAAGVDSPSLRILAGLTGPTADDAIPWLERVRVELGLASPRSQDAALAVACSYARRIVAGELTPRDGAGAIWREAFYEARPDHDLSAFVAEADSIDESLAYRVRDPAYYEGLIAVAEAAILADAATLLREHPAL